MDYRNYKQPNISQLPAKQQLPIIVRIDQKLNIQYIEIYKRQYEFDMNDKLVNENIQLLQFLMNIQEYQNLLKNKEQEKFKDQKLLQVVSYSNFTALEYYLLKMQNDIIKQKKKIDFKEQEQCVICMCDLYDEIEKYDYKKFDQQLQTSNDDDVIMLKDCFGHYFHKNCIINCIKENFIKCPVCQKIYGIMTGDQPDGEMLISIDKNIHCKGYENVGSIIINYRMKGGNKGGKPYDGTVRSAYLPDNQGGREILGLLKTAFDRKLVFTIGRSVTTGQEPAIVWNGIHHKTSNSGGTSNFGYPDPTYFNRVKEELALKGVI